MQPEPKALTCRSLLRATRSKDEQCPSVEQLRQASQSGSRARVWHADLDPCPELPTSDKAEVLAGTAECH